MCRIRLGLIAVCLLASSGYAQVLLDTIRIENVDNAPLDESFVRAYTSLRAGQEIEGEAELNAAVARDVRNLRQSGRFAYVRAYLEQDDEKLTLVYSVSARLRLRSIEVTGANHIGNRKIKKELELELGDYVDEALVGERTRAVEAYCRKNKYPDAAVSWDMAADKTTGGADLTVTVDEGLKKRVKRIELDGELFKSDSALAKTGRFFKKLVPRFLAPREPDTLFETAEIRDVMQQKKTWWITPWFGTYRPELIEADLASIRSFYQDRGFLDVKVSGPEVVDLGNGRLELAYTIIEGISYRIGTVSFEGNMLFDDVALASQVLLVPDGTASRAQIDQSAAAVNRYYGNRGYIRNYVEPLITTDPESETADVRFVVAEGQLASINEIEVRGNEKTRDEVIRRELAVYPGETFHQQRIETSEQRLRNLGYFETVNSSYTPALQSTNAYDLTFRVKEKAMGSFMVGAGFSSVDSLVGFTELSHGNFDIQRWPPIGDGQKVRLRLQLGSSRNDVELSFVEPWFLDRKLSLGVDFYRRSASYYSDNFDLGTIGGSVSLTKPLGPFTRGTLRYSLEQYDVQDVSTNVVELLSEEGERIKSTLGFSVSRDTRDQFYIPTRGNYSSAGVEFSGGPLAGDTDIYMIEARSSQFWPLLNDHVFNLKGSVATVDSYGSGNVPIFDRLFLGGPRTIRAFDYRDVSPRSVSAPSEPIGGLSSWYATAEYTVPLWKKVRAAVFYDVGAVSAEVFDPFGGDVNSGYGFGARFDLPMFPLRLDYAIPHISDSDNQDASGRWNFLMGYTF